ncbi:hypothetical protein MIR68_006538 [Amoeboaphelidium protococcarum]|nr:hypothetical protein MIR68_006538 [Amoeboaphelidium protococcarum]
MLKRVTSLRAFSFGIPLFNSSPAAKVIEVSDSAAFQKVLKSDNLVLVDFYANWCGPCKMLTPVLTKVVNNQSGVTMIKVDVDAVSDVAQQYRISSLPTVVAMKNGSEVGRFIGLKDEQKVKQFINQFQEK